MTELGETNDPTALVPGDPDALVDTVLALAKYGSLLQEAGSGLSKIDVSTGWTGEAADAFHSFYHGQPSKWLKAGDAFQDASTALDNYAATLTWGQQQAASAIDQWNAGTPAHAAAQDTLAFVRDQVANAGNTAADAIGKARDQAPAKPGFWSEVGGFFSGAGRDLEHAGKAAINGLASLGNAALHDPGSLAATLGGVLLTGVSAAGDGLGVALDATGVGAVAGVPLNAISTAGVVAGVGLAGAGATALVRDAAGPDQMNVMNREGGGSEGREKPPPKSKQEIHDQATSLGYTRKISPQRAPFNSHGQDVFTDGKNYLTPDADGHTVTGWKLFNKRFRRVGTYSWDLKTRVKD